MSNTYTIIDEPKPSRLDSLIADPIVILFAALIVPLIINLPLYGRFWLPLIWVIANGFLLGSPTRVRELIYAVGAAIVMASIIYSLFYVSATNPELAKSAAPYIAIVVQGVLFFSMYLIVFQQSAAYQIHKYLKDSRQ